METDTCLRCGHPADWHRLDDATNVSPTDPAAQFRCLGYNCEVGGPPGGRACGCPDMVRSPTDEELAAVRSAGREVDALFRQAFGE